MTLVVSAVRDDVVDDAVVAEDSECVAAEAEDAFSLDCSTIFSPLGSVRHRVTTFTFSLCDWFAVCDSTFTIRSFH